MYHNLCCFCWRKPREADEFYCSPRCLVSAHHEALLLQRDYRAGRSDFDRHMVWRYWRLRHRHCKEKKLFRR
jgi:hypothetical protein